MERLKKFVFEAEDGIYFDVSQRSNGEVIFKARHDVKPVVAADSSKNYMNPPIPVGYQHVFGEWNNGFVIERAFDKSQFVWIPVGSLDADGTLNGFKFSSQFGRRNFRNDPFSENQFHEPITEQLSLQINSVEKYGGYYISCHEISKSPTGKPQSVKGAMPWAYVTLNDAQKISASFENSRAVTSHLTFGAEYDPVLVWFLKSKSLHFNEIAEDSTELGNYKNSSGSACKLANTGANEKWKINNTYDFAGNLCEWTQELSGVNNAVIRGGCFRISGSAFPMAMRYHANPYVPYEFVGFRIVLCIN